MTKRRSLALACSGKFPYHTAVLYRMTDSVFALEYKHRTTSRAPTELRRPRKDVRSSGPWYTHVKGPVDFAGHVDAKVSEVGHPFH